MCLWPLYILGDFNCFLDHSLDKHPPVVQGRGTYHTALKKLVEEVGWTDPWRGKTPGEKQFLCFCKSHLLLLCIDLCSITATRYVSEIKYALRGISDHSPLALILKVRPPSTLSRAPWKLNAFWLSLFPFQIAMKITDFPAYSAGYPYVGLVWETSKAFLWGLFIREITAIKKVSNAQR